MLKQDVSNISMVTEGLHLFCYRYFKSTRPEPSTNYT